MKRTSAHASQRADPPPLARKAHPSRLRILLAMRYYRRHLHEGVAAFCREQRWVQDSLDHSPDLNQANQWDGIILLHQRVPELQDLLRKPAPIVTLAMDESGGILPPAVLQDQEAIGVLGAWHLLKRGFRRLVFCGYEDAISHARYRGMRAEAQKQGAAYREVSLPHRAPATSGSDFIHQWLGAHLLGEATPFAVLAAHDSLGVTVMDACHEAGLKLPEQVAVLGVDNEEIICDCACVPLSSVDNNLFQHGYEAASLLGSLMRGESPPDRPLLIPPRRVVVRASTDAIADQDPRLASILQHLHEHLHAPTLSVKTLGLRSGLSRRALETLFREAKLKPPGQVIHEVRLWRACTQLANGDQTVPQIAAACGFASPASFIALGQTAYRVAHFAHCLQRSHRPDFPPIRNFQQPIWTVFALAASGPCHSKQYQYRISYDEDQQDQASLCADIGPRPGGQCGRSASVYHQRRFRRPGAARWGGNLALQRAWLGGV